MEPGDIKPDNRKKTDTGSPLNFIQAIIAEDLKTGKYDGRVHTRFPPEPNGYLHIGHAKSICLNFGLAAEYPAGKCNLRFDDTNPVKEEDEYVEAIKEDVRWLGFDWGDRLCYGSDYFEQMYLWAEQLVKAGKAYVCDLSAEETRQYRGTLTAPGRESPYRNRSVEENLDLLRRMRYGEFPDGSRTLRAKIDMAAANLNMRDPVMYRILHAEHHRTGDAWCIYPMYDWAHGLEDSIERITHSICTLEFENHRPLYDWFLDALDEYHPQQIEFARLNLTYTVMSKRKLLKLVTEGHVSGWDDPRLPTICALRRRGYTPEAIREFCRRIGVNKIDSVVDIALLEHCLREDLNRRAPRVLGVLRPLKLVIDNYPKDLVEELDAVNNPEDPAAGTRKLPFSRELYIERTDYMEDPPKKYFRLAPGREVRLRYGYYVTCVEAVKDSAGNVVELHCTSLGLGQPCRRGRGPALRPPVHPAESRRRPRRSRLHCQSEPRLAGSALGVLRRAGPGRRRGRKPVPIRTPRVFLRRSRFNAPATGLQPHRIAPRHLGENPEEVAREEVVRACTHTQKAPSLDYGLRFVDRGTCYGKEPSKSLPVPDGRRCLLLMCAAGLLQIPGAVC